MRYSIIDRGAGIAKIESLIKNAGGKDIHVSPRIGQVFCELDPQAASSLEHQPGILVKQVKSVTTKDVRTPEPPVIASPYASPVEPSSVYASSQASLASLFYDLRESFSPPLTGEGFTICVLDTGIRKTHISLVGKVIEEYNLSGSPTVDDVFNHGTGVAFAAAGGRHAVGEECGLAPGARLINIKVINDDGSGTTEAVIDGIEKVMEIHESAVNRGLTPYDPEFPNGVNMSFGTPDDDDPDNPLQLALGALRDQTLGDIVAVVAAAGNGGPDAGSIELPASSRYVWAIGGVTFSPFEIWEQSARGPSALGLVKPELVFYCVNVLLASGESDTAFTVKTGTSFACPYCAGGMALIQDWAWRYFPLEVLYAFKDISSEAWRDIVASVSAKGIGAPIEQDNSWGYGMPMGDKMLRHIQSMESAGYESITSMMTMIVPIGMMGMMMGAMRR